MHLFTSRISLPLSSSSAVTEAFERYQSEMEAELREVMRFLNRVGDDRDPRDEWFRSPAGTFALRLSLSCKSRVSVSAVIILLVCIDPRNDNQ